LNQGSDNFPPFIVAPSTTQWWIAEGDRLGGIPFQLSALGRRYNSPPSLRFLRAPCGFLSYEALAK